MKNKESYGKFIETARRNSSQATVPEGFTRSVMDRVSAVENGRGLNYDGRSAIILRWRIASVCITSAAAALLLVGLFSVTMPRNSGTRSTRELAAQEIPVLSLEERIEIYSHTRAAADFIAELDK